MDTTSVAVTVGAGFFIAGITQFLKGIIEHWLKPGSPNHDITIQLTAALVGAIGFIVHARTVTSLTGPIFWDSAAQGALAGVAAVTAYHVLTATVPGTDTASTQIVVSQPTSPAEVPKVSVTHLPPADVQTPVPPPTPLPAPTAE